MRNLSTRVSWKRNPTTLTYVMLCHASSSVPAGTSGSSTRGAISKLRMARSRHAAVRKGRGDAAGSINGARTIARCGSRDSVVRAAQRRDVELLHLQHCLHGALRPRVVPMFVELVHEVRDDLPRHAVAILEPPALLRLRIASRGKLRPVVIDFILRRAVHLQRDRFVEREDGPAVERRERLSVELERDDHHRPGGAMMNLEPGLTEARDRRDARVLEDARVE